MPTHALFARVGLMLVYPLFSCRRRLWSPFESAVPTSQRKDGPFRMADLHAE
jgi:hypothetical protein